MQNCEPECAIRWRCCWGQWCSSWTIQSICYVLSSPPGLPVREFQPHLGLGSSVGNIGKQWRPLVNLHLEEKTANGTCLHFTTFWDVSKYRKDPNETKPKALVPDSCNYIIDQRESIDNNDIWSWITMACALQTKVRDADIKFLLCSAFSHCACFFALSDILWQW